MSVPGSNLLIQALQMLGRHSVEYFKSTGRTTQPNGTYVTALADGVTIETGQVQPVPRTKYLQLGFDASRYYVTWYVPQLDVMDVKRGESGDQFEYGGKRFQVVENNDWYQQDGWIGVVGIEINRPSVGV